ncbi:putative L-type lectin-domain containing receptor kinase S.7 [Triticum urartu]|uniref:Putative L-type lectin-domain containing receptor kinase S.7 n=1 Tax=Triticum urartu TaxID=4572 RepID=M7ZAW7_TRIUA|nr:putative L-type lectin-domain containing receptor kinase S.7 [Triticum urartu]
MLLPRIGMLKCPSRLINRQDLLADGIRIGDKPGLDTCVVSQVMADSLARLPLEGCRDTRPIHGGKCHAMTSGVLLACYSPGSRSPVSPVATARIHTLMTDTFDARSCMPVPDRGPDTGVAFPSPGLVLAASVRRRELSGNRGSTSWWMANGVMHFEVPGMGLANYERKIDHASALPRKFSYDLLKEITDGFSEERLLGSGGYGRVYKLHGYAFKQGFLKDGEEIAVKLLYEMPTLDDVQFMREFNNLTSLQHVNIVRLVGYCHETRPECAEYEGRTVVADRIHRALCFDYAHNGSLHDHISANVLLDKNMLPKIADFGLSRLFGEEQTKITNTSFGTRGYLPPEYIEQKVISNKFDIYSLGVVIIKVQGNWRARLEAPPIHEPGLEAYCVQVKTCIEIALKCVQADRRKRPSINDIIDKMNQTENMIRLWSLNVYSKRPYFAPDISGLTRFEYNDLAVMTDGFSKHLGLGAFGMVYKGSYKDLNGYQQVAVKEIKNTTEGEVHDFIAELQRIGRMRLHTNLIELKGWQQRVQFFLVFEFVPNANLEDHLHEWQKRYQIIKGIGSALHHLHHQCNRAVLHGDIKPSSVLLDFDFNAKLGVGLSRTASKNNRILVATDTGTEGNMDPRKSDIYSFGIVLLEIACTGKSREQVWELYREEPEVMEYAADRRLGGIFDKSQMKRVIVLGLRCSHPNGRHRPFMSDAMKFLEDGIELPPILEIEEQRDSRFLGIYSAEFSHIVIDVEHVEDGIELHTILEIEEQEGSRFLGIESANFSNINTAIDPEEAIVGIGGSSSWLKGVRWRWERRLRMLSVHDL